MSRPLPIVAAEMREAAFAVLDREQADIDYQREAIEETIRQLRAMMVPRTAERDHSSRPRW